MLHLTPGIFASFVKNLNAARHSHHLIQINLPVSDCIAQVGDKTLFGPSVIASGVGHSLKMTSGWVILVEPKSVYGGQLQSNSCAAIEINTAPKSNAKLAELIRTVGLTELPTTDLDPRIDRLLAQLDACFNAQTCLKPSHFSANTIAESLYLSPSRFLHLFTEQVGIAWRPYVLWRRLICSVVAIQQGNNLTQAAMLAGFADSAHLSRTFKRQFGITPTEALKTQSAIN
ncbi:helix-turn-helix transcriptional regulator [Pseudoalteromonas sp. B530]|uniref:helix-turn-helix transcriptional regulator n=1 Tax=Pseudoalteromonas sp. B530 TaxID=2994390 RepID=UPI00224B420A|nr:AraC family transcriptional regulator [Pseudoalteromonas sp. B530]MCX2769548.1 AraC family transcriptional regulator [Pseudoalteromonas sp. B530]